VVVIKKSRDIAIEKNIASFFRKENIVEYKSPEDYVSVRDFYKVYGYACLYGALNKVDIKDLTLTFVESRHPRELLKHLQEVRGYTVEERLPGIYIIRGDILPIQIIDNRRLSEEENIWLKDLDNRLNTPKMRRITTEIHKLGKDKITRIKAYLDVIARANIGTLEEVIKMSDSSLALEKIFEEVGWIAKWEARGRNEGREEGREEVARNALAQGASPDFVQKITGLDMQTITSLRD